MTELGDWYTDTESDAVESLAAAADFFERATSNPSYWKWAVVALHSAVQGFLVLSLDQGNGLLVQKPSRAKEILAVLQGCPGRLDPYMDNFMGLYRKAADPANFPNGKPPIPVDPALAAAIELFDQWRHDFLHFNSKGWSIGLSLLISRCHAALSAASHILSSDVIRWNSEELAEESGVQLKRAREALPAER